MKLTSNVLALAWPLLLLACSTKPTVQAQSDQTNAATIAPAQPAIPLAGRVTDVAHLLSSDTKVRLSAKLENLEASTHHQLVVVTVNSLGGRDIDDFSRDLANAWGIGRKGHNDGVVLLVAPKERKVRITVGRALEATLTPVVCEQIIAAKIIPRFRSGDLAGGIESGADALISRLN